VSSFNPLDNPVCMERPLYVAPSAWMMHVPFAMYLVDVARPRVFVELGSHYGVSYCAFCQAVKHLGAGTKCYAVDTWQGDPQAGFFGQEVLDELRGHHDPLYGDFSTLLRMTFAEAASRFGRGSVDLLHVDGFHTYEAVKNDYETWLPLMSERGVMLFHDIAVREGDFGVWRLWDELKSRRPHYEVEFGHGLGVLAVGDEYPPALDRLFRATPDELEAIRDCFRRLGALSMAAQEFDAHRRAEAALGAEEEQRRKRMRREHPLLTRASNLLQVWADAGFGGAVGLAASKAAPRPASESDGSIEDAARAQGS